MLQQRLLQRLRVLQQHVLLLLLLLLLLRALQQHEEMMVHSRDGSHPTESLVEQNCGSTSGHWLCVSWAESSCPTESRREKKRKTTINIKKYHVSVCSCTL